MSVSIIPQSLKNDEVLLKEDDNRYVLFPIDYPAIFEMYKKARILGLLKRLI